MVIPALHLCMMTNTFTPKPDNSSHLHHLRTSTRRIQKLLFKLKEEILLMLILVLPPCMMTNTSTQKLDNSDHLHHLKTRIKKILKPSLK